VNVFAANKADLFELSDKLLVREFLRVASALTKLPLHCRRAGRPEWPICESTSTMRDPKGWSQQFNFAD